jgi:hypothetical protein
MKSLFFEVADYDSGYWIFLKVKYIKFEINFGIDSSQKKTIDKIFR